MVKKFIGHKELLPQFIRITDETFMTTGKDGKAFLWHIGYGLKLHKIQHPKGAILAQTWLPESNQILTAGTDGIIRLWSSDLKKVVKLLLVILQK